MFELIAESSAIEDTFYYLEKALQTERITLDVFLKVGGYRWLVQLCDTRTILLFWTWI